MTLDSAWRVVGRLLAVGLPFLAANAIGGERVAVILLIAVAKDTATGEESAAPTKSRNMRHFLKTRRWVLGVIVLQIITDVIGVTGSVKKGWEMALGYMALAASVFLLPLPFPTSTFRAPGVTSPMPKSSEKTSAIPSPWETTQVVSRTSSGPLAICPLTSTSKDIDLTLLAGALMGFTVLVSNLILYPASALFSFSDSGIGLVVSCIASLSLIISDPASLMTTRRLGLALGLFLPLIVQETFFIQPWSVFACQGVVVGLFWTAINLDTHFVPSAAFSPSLVHQHGVETHLGSHSGFTRLLLSATRDWPLLHSILVEKDSRRIFYFMR